MLRISRDLFRGADIFHALAYARFRSNRRSPTRRRAFFGLFACRERESEREREREATSGPLVQVAWPITATADRKMGYLRTRRSGPSVTPNLIAH